jgi:general L-amino acid transport system permease protein
MQKARKIWQHPQFWPWAIQGMVLLLLGLVVLMLSLNLVAHLQQRQPGLSFSFLQSQTGVSFDKTGNLSPSLIPYSPNQTYLDALWTGLINSLRILALGLVLSTAIGVGVGSARLSSNWLLRQLAKIYVEGLRHTPLLLQLVFWYIAVLVSGPPFEQRLSILGELSFSQRGLLIPSFAVRLSFMTWLICLAIGLFLARWVWRRQHRLRIESGEPIQPWFMAIVTLLFWLSVAWILTKETPFSFAWPSVLDNTKIQSGLLLSPPYSALLLGLTLYTAAYIAEIVWSGILTIPQGQWEVSQSLGLSSGLTLRLVVLPQALRVMLPSLTRQYLNLAKNSSLAIAVGYPDLYATVLTTFHRTGRAVEVMLLLVAAYLAINLLIELIMNRFDRRLQIHER